MKIFLTVKLRKLTLVGVCCLFVFSQSSVTFAKFNSSVVRKKLIKVTNSQRTLLTLTLFSTVIADMIAEAEAEKESLATKIKRFFNSSYNPDELISTRKVCVSRSIQSWFKFASTGKYAQTHSILNKLSKPILIVYSTYFSNLLVYILPLVLF